MSCEVPINNWFQFGKYNILKKKELTLYELEMYDIYKFSILLYFKFSIILQLSWY